MAISEAGLRGLTLRVTGRKAFIQMGEWRISCDRLKLPIVLSEILEKVKTCKQESV